MPLIFRYQDTFKDQKTVTSPFVLSPMASFTSWPFRLICQQYGAGCTITEMTKPEHIIRKTNPPLIKQLLMRHPDERITGAQLVGADPAHMEGAAKIIADTGFDFLDLNAACPARRIRKSGAGGALLEQPERIAGLLNALAKSGLPITIKLRSGSRKSPKAALEAVRIAADCGVSAIWFHARNIYQGYDSREKPDHRFSSEIVAKAAVPVFVGGGIETAQHAVKVLHETGAAGVLIARGALGNPFIFRDALAILNGSQPSPVPLTEVVSAMREHFKGILTLMGERKAFLHMRTLFQQYLRFSNSLEPFVEKGKLVTSSRQAYELLDAMEKQVL